jgi:ATP-dependent DNA helicase RecG
LLSKSNSPEAIERLNVLKNNTNGFKISEYDYDMRGGGDFLGVRQSGKLMTDLGDLKYTVGAIFTAKKISDDYFAGNDDVSKIKDIAMSKYSKLKDIAMN